MREIILLILLMLAPLLSTAHGGSDHAAKLLPVPSCGPGWTLEGKAEVYNRETLSDRINGEAEIFFPYGFESLAYGRYGQGENGFDLDVYRMGSLLDAFGVYAGYRSEGAEPVATGAEGVVTSSQLFFYQGRYFVRMQSTGDSDAGKAALVSCAEAVSRLLPGGQGKPRELNLLDVPEVDKRSIEYHATSLLGYDFFPRGFMANTSVAGEPARVFLVMAGSDFKAAEAFHAFRNYLQQSEPKARVVARGGVLTGVDPLYGKVVAWQVGPYVVGIVKAKEYGSALALVKKLRLRLRSM